MSSSSKRAARQTGCSRKSNYEVVTPDYFKTVGTPLLEGRDFRRSRFRGRRNRWLLSAKRWRSVFAPPAMLRSAIGFAWDRVAGGARLWASARTPVTEASRNRRGYFRAVPAGHAADELRGDPGNTIRRSISPHWCAGRWRLWIPVKR